MFGSRRKHVKAICLTSAGVGSKEIGGDTKQDNLSHNSHKRQNKINAQANKIAMVKAKLNKALQENKKVKDLFNLHEMVDTITKVVGAITEKKHPKTSQGTQYKGTSNYIGRQQQPQLTHGTNGKMEPNTMCYCYKDTRHMKDICVQLNNKIACELQLQEQVTAAKITSKKIPDLEIIPAQILDQSEGGKVCGPDWNDKSNMDKRIVGLIKEISSQNVFAEVMF